MSLKLTIKTKLMIILFLVSLIPLITIGFISINRSRVALSDQAFEQLKSILNINSFQVKRYFENLESDITVLANSSHIVAALNGFSSTLKDGVIDKSQYDYFESLEYGDSFRKFTKEYGYYDMLLITIDGDIVYSLKKESDLTQNVIAGSLKETNLGKVFHKGLETVVITDFAPYPPSGNLPILFLVAPIGLLGDTEGLVVLKLTNDTINAIMTEHSSGMPKTSETYLVGPDKLMRSDSYLDPEHHSVKASFANPEKGSVDTKASRNALSGISGEEIISDYRGVSVLSAYMPFTFYHTTYALIAEINKEEAFRPVNNLKNMMIIATIVTMLITFLITLFIANKSTKPIETLTLSSIEISEGNLEKEVRVNSNDEFGILAQSFNKMRSSIRDKILALDAEIQERSRVEKELKDAHDNLENRIAERTKELSEEIAERKRAEQLAEKDVKVKTGLNELNEAMKNAHRISILANNIICQIARFLEIPLAAFFVLNREKVFQRVGSFGYPQSKNLPDYFKPGSGIIGQAAKDMKPVILEEIPEYAKVTLGFGDAPPKTVLAYPLVYDDQCIGVLELAGFKEFTEDQLNWIAQASKSISSALRTIIDIYEIKHNEKLLQENEDKLKIAKLEAEDSTKAKSDFLANMSHEIRTPMNAVIGLCYLALKTDLNPKQNDYLVKIENSAKNLLGIINDILDFSKIEAGKLDMEKVDFRLDDVLEDLANLVSVKAEEKKLQVLYSVSEDVPLFLIGDSLRLGQILINLCNNAVKFTEKGEIVVSIKMICDEPEDAVLQFSVRDSGIGLTREQIAKLFQSFSQADTSTTRKFGGTGLGLTISRRLVEMMGGRIWVESEPGEWSEFIFTARFGKSKVIKEKRRMPAGNMKGMNALVVDDNITAQHVFHDALESFSFKVKTTGSGEEAIQILEKADSKNPYKLILMDWKMHGMDGIEAASRIKSNKNIPQKPRIILVTSYGREEVMLHAEEAGLDAFLIKPVNNSMLFNTIMDVFGEDVSGRKIAKKRETAKEEAAEKLRGASTLLAEDNEINQQVAVELLEAVGIVVDVVDNGRKAVEAVKASRYDLVLMDLQMPVLGGLEATIEIRADDSLKELPIVAMTANAMKEDIDRCHEAGMDDHVAKPIETEELYKALLKWIKPREGVMPDLREEDSSEKSETINPDIEIPVISGINAELGISRLGGNKKLFKKILIDFRDKYPDITDEIRAGLNENDNKTAERLAHTIKGLAGNIGAEVLSKTAAELESAIKNNEMDKQEEKLNNFAYELSHVIEALKIIKDEKVEMRPNEGPESSNEVLLDALKKLEQPLGKRKPKDCKAAMKGALDLCWPEKLLEDVNKINGFISKYKFKEAKEELNAIIKKLGE